MSMGERDEIFQVAIPPPPSSETGVLQGFCKKAQGCPALL